MKITQSNAGKGFPAGVRRLEYGSDWAYVFPGEKAGMVYLHGHGSDGTQFFQRNPEGVKFLLKNRIGFLTPNIRSNSWMEPETAAELARLVRYAKKEFKWEKVIFAGGSMGASSSLIFAVRYPELCDGVVALCPATDPERFVRWSEQPGRLSVSAEIASAIRKAYKNDPALLKKHSVCLHADKLSMPVILLHGEGDTIIPVSESRHLAGKMAGKKDFSYREVRHGLHDLSRTVSMMDEVICMCGKLGIALKDPELKKTEKLKDITSSLQKEIDAAANYGGGRVTVPPGRYGIRQIFMKSNVELHLSQNTELVSLQTPADARVKDKADPEWFLIGGDGVCNVSITGQGRINGNGYAFWKKKPGVEYSADSPHGPQYGWIGGRPLGMIHFRNSCDIILKDVELADPPTYTVWLLGCDRGLIRNVRINTDQAGPNTDGLDIDCCSHISIADCNIKAGDDAIALKSSLHHLGYEKACEKITVRNCRLGSRHCGIRLGWEGDSPIRDCIFTDNIMISNIGISILSITAAQGNVKKGSVIRDIIFSNNIMDVGAAFQIRQGRVDGPNPPKGYIDNVLIDNTIVRTKVGSYIAGFPGNPIRNLTIRHLAMTMKDFPWDDYSARKDWVPPETDAFRIPGGTELPFGLAFHCVEGLKLEDYRMITGHPERWLKGVKCFSCNPVKQTPRKALP